MRLATCYPVPGKQKALLTCDAFADGIRRIYGRASAAEVSAGVPQTLGPGAAVFYGVRAATRHLWVQAESSGRDRLYIDNSFFDCVRERQFRVAKNAIQCTGLGQSDGKRLRALGVSLKPWRSGSHILVCVQSQEFMGLVAGDSGWLGRMTKALQSVTDRRLVIRSKADGEPFQSALRGAHAVVTYSSAAAVEALVAGVPVVCAETCAAYPMSTPLAEIETPRTPDREQWAAVLADNQWTLDELRRGDAWRALNQ